MIKFLNRNKYTLIIGTVISAAVCFATYKILPLYFVMPLYGLILASIGAFALVFAGCYFLGNDTVKSAFFRLAIKVLPKEVSDNIVSVTENAIKEVEAAKAKEQEEERIKAEAIRRINAEKAEAEAKAKAEAKEKENAEKKAKDEEKAHVVKVQEDNAKAEYEAKVQAMMNQLKQSDNK